MEETRYFHRRRLWAAMFGAPFVWGTHLLLVWALTEVGCRVGAGTATWFGVYALHVVTLSISSLSLGALLFIIWTSYRVLKQVRGMDAEDEREIERTCFMAWTGITFGIGFGVVSTYMTIPIFVLPLC